MFRVIDEWIHSARDRKILKDRFINGLALEALAERHDMSASHIRRIIEDNKPILFGHMK